MSRYIILEIGKSAYTEFKKKSGDFEETCDAILVDDLDADSKEDAYNQMFSKEEHSDKDFDQLVVLEVV
ncbi:hypothetical protein JXA48_02070 [Candidatus Woesearchaeota archaeon]|nr:hypothetical protein [Candidatus Woesearchaeota archaeon]